MGTDFLYKQEVTIANFHLHSLTERMTYNEFFESICLASPSPTIWGLAINSFGIGSSDDEAVFVSGG